MKPIAIVDVDETLWPLHDAVWATGEELGIKIPKRNECTGWDTIYKYAGKESVTCVFNEVHSRQCSYRPYPDAERFLRFMRTRFHVVIASHRLDKYKPELVEWLKTNNLVYDEVVVTADKTQMFDNPRVTVVVDDRADTIIAALRKGKMGVGLRKPWNQNVRIPAHLFDTLTEIEDHLIQRGFVTFQEQILGE
jgi:FMN phosphatase YigB (HAD superfamily)